MTKKTIKFITGNVNKYNEVREFLKEDYDVKMVEMDLPEIQGTIREIIVNKVKVASMIVDGNFIVEDSSLQYFAMNGMPGPYIKWFYNAIGNDGLVKMINGFEDQNASAVSSIAFCQATNKNDRDVESVITIFQGVIPGKIVDPKGANGFCWDKIFVPHENNNEGLTFAQMSHDKKNEMSHRRLALNKLIKYLDIHTELFK
jgi:inosine triphosphate pyrophosphatase